MSSLFRAGALSLATLVTALSAYALSAHKSQYMNGKKVCLKCDCGKFTGALTLPNNPSQLAGLRVTCHCVDCFKWASEVVKHGGLTERHGDEVVMVYKGSVCIDTPDQVHSVRLYEKSTNHRYITKCCGSAIGLSMSGSPVLVLSAGLVVDKPALTSDSHRITIFV